MAYNPSGTTTVVGTKTVLDVNLAASAGAVAATSGTLTTSSTIQGSGVAAGSYVQASIGQMGNGTIVLSGGTYTALTLVFEATVDGANWFYIDAVRVDGSAVVNGQTGEVFAAAGVRAWNYMAPGYATIRVRASALTSTVFPTITITQGPFLYDPSPTVPPVDGIRSTYSSPLNATSVAAAVTTSVPIWELVNPVGSGKIVRVLRLAWELTLATAGTAPEILLQKRTAASTAGTAVTQTPTPHDSINPAPSATGKYYTANPALAGSLLGNVRGHRVFGFATTLTAQPTFVEWTFGNRPGQALILRPGESVNMQGIAAFGTAPTLTGSAEWTEEPFQ